MSWKPWWGSWSNSLSRKLPGFSLSIKDNLSEIKTLFDLFTFGNEDRLRATHILGEGDLI